MPKRSSMMNEPMEREMVERVWRNILTTGEEKNMGKMRHLMRLIPRNPRCRTCNAPFKGVGGFAVRHLLGKQPSKLNPTVCNACELFAKKHPGGANVELAMLFADVRGSTALAEKLGDREFSMIIDRFYRVATDVLVRSEALIEKLIGDEVAAMYFPGFAGQEYTRRAVETALQILRATGHGTREGPWLSVGAGVHKGTAFVGAVGTRGKLVEITALGDTVNTAARLAAAAGPGELLVSEEAASAGGFDASGTELRRLRLKGRKEPIDVRVFHSS
jgi:adenylate cyclase